MSVTAARLLVSAFKEGDFTGWPDFVRMDDGVWMTQLYLSVSRRRMVYSVVAKAQDPQKTRCIFVLCINQVSKGMEHYNNKVGIMDVLLADSDMDPRLVMSIDYGEHIVLDAVKQPAVRSLDDAKRSVVTGDSHYDTGNDDGFDRNSGDDGVGDDDDMGHEDDEYDDSRRGLFGSFSSAAQKRKDRKGKVEKAKVASPPRGRAGLRRPR